MNLDGFRRALYFMGWGLVVFGSIALVTAFINASYVAMVYCFIMTGLTLLYVVELKEVIFQPSEAEGVSMQEFLKVINNSIVDSVEILQKYQDDSNNNLFVCLSTTPHPEENSVLVPTMLGWRCPTCAYRQPYSQREHDIIQAYVVAEVAKEEEGDD